MHTSPKIYVFLLNACYDVVSSAQSVLGVENVRGPVGVGEGEHLLLKVWTWQNLNIYVQVLPRNGNSRSMGQWEGGRGEKNSAWDRVEKGSRLPQAPEHPTAGLCVARCNLQTKGSNAKQLLIFIVLLLLFVCWLRTVVQMLLCWVQGWGGGNAGVALYSMGSLAPREQHWPALAKVYW